MSEDFTGMSESDYENIDKSIPQEQQIIDEEEEDHDNLHKNFESMNVMNDCFNGGFPPTTDRQQQQQPPFNPIEGMIKMIGGNDGMGKIFGGIGEALNAIPKSTVLKGNIDGANFMLEISNEFSCRTALNILNQMMKKFKEPQPPTTPTEEEK